MSSTIDVYAVPTEQLKRAIGSGDRALAEMVLAGHRDFFSRVDEIDDESELKAADALRESGRAGSRLPNGSLQSSKS